MCQKKIMIIIRTHNLSNNIQIYNQPIEQVERYGYLGYWIKEGLEQEIEIWSRMEMPISTFKKMGNLLTNIYSVSKIVLLSGVEMCTFWPNTMNKLEAFELLRIIKRWKASYPGQIYRGPNYTFIRLIIEVKVDVKSGSRRRKCS